MRTASQTRHSRRQIRFAEAGILFVLILAVAIFVGVKFTAKSPEEPAADPGDQLSMLQTASGNESGSELTPGGLGRAEPAAPEANLAREDLLNDEAAVEGSRTETPDRVVSYAMAEAAFFEARYAEAVDLFAAYVSRKPQNAWGHYMLGLSRWKDDSPGAAEESFQEALEIQPDHAKSLINLARVLLEQERASEALPLIEKAVALTPESADAYRVLGRVYDNLQRREEAITAYKQALLRNGDDAWALNNLGLLYIESGQYLAALEPLARAVQLQSDRAPFQNNLGIALERNGYNAQAAEAYERALEADGDYGKAEVSLTRVQQLPQDTGHEPFDLVAAADGFIANLAAAQAVQAAIVAVEGANDANGSSDGEESLSSQQP